MMASRVNVWSLLGVILVSVCCCTSADTETGPCSPDANEKCSDCYLIVHSLATLSLFVAIAFIAVIIFFIRREKRLRHALFSQKKAAIGSPPSVSVDDLYSSTSAVQVGSPHSYMVVGWAAYSEVMSGMPGPLPAEVPQDPTSDGLYSSTSELDMDAPNLNNGMELFNSVDTTPQAPAPVYVEIIPDPTVDGLYNSTSELDMDAPNSYEVMEMPGSSAAAPPASVPVYLELIHDPIADEHYSSASNRCDNAPPGNVTLSKTTSIIVDGCIDMAKEYPARNSDKNTYVNVTLLRYP
ncbi:hypothetical protein PoB_002184000 [Plakobranchus ocellatus]|uniref:Uncharacterized protein n=1 Tax=Plakobranchus ocellatus TaxID=259542 RepID=A0AAV3ZLA1_9GAST|nr:hypothetical protein PoB_002184000 [Plakobranchus ocellatus]